MERHKTSKLAKALEPQPGDGNAVLKDPRYGGLCIRDAISSPSAAGTLAESDRVGVLEQRPGTWRWFLPQTRRRPRRGRLPLLGEGRVLGSALAGTSCHPRGTCTGSTQPRRVLPFRTLAVVA